MDDLIRRIDAIHALTQSSDYIADALERLEKVPTVNAVVQENTRFVQDDNRYYHWHCEACGFTMGIVWRFYNFCPCCGSVILKEGTK